MEGPKTLEDDFSVWKGLRQRKRKQIIPNGRAKDNQRGRFFRVEGPQREKEEANYSKWKGQRQRKRTVFPSARFFHVEGSKTKRKTVPWTG